ncbi:hypothetical protein [Stutzerimonas nitrititolerans]|uniref:Uncharacterized protein n=2 Tax=Stutzerimonas nitrititolerans TaxID=2482751 RepID=A0AA41WCW5_9GAMM|nr:hypothetical protein [Stutzerimonas nitrititolerans]MCO7543254.1 hypothetical protein [Stutzerimonas nitrititolerans]
MDRNSALRRRKDILQMLGFHGLAPRFHWSHEVDQTIVFDAWDHQWQRDDKGARIRYPLRTNGAHYNLAESKQNPRAGHSRWQCHVDMVIGGQRTPRAIVPVANDPNAKPNRGAKGWRPLVIDGHIEVEDGQIWFCVDGETPL